MAYSRKSMKKRSFRKRTTKRRSHRKRHTRRQRGRGTGFSSMMSVEYPEHDDRSPLYERGLYDTTDMRKVDKLADRLMFNEPDFYTTKEKALEGARYRIQENIRHQQAYNDPDFKAALDEETSRGRIPPVPEYPLKAPYKPTAETDALREQYLTERRAQREAKQNLADAFVKTKKQLSG